MATSTGIAALASALGLLHLPHALALLDLRLPGIFRLHMIASGLGLILLPWAMLLRHNGPAHRAVGRATAILLIVGIAASLPCALMSAALPAARAGFMTQGLLSLALLIRAVIAISRGQRLRHQRAMLRVAALLSGVVMLRLMVSVAADWPAHFDVAYAVIAWVSWLVPLAAIELWLRRPFGLSPRRWLRPSQSVILLVTAAAILCLLSRDANAQPVVTFQGVGPVRIGMTAVAAEQALGARLKKLDGISGDDEKSCWIGSRADGVDPDLTYMFEFGKLTRIDVSGNEEAGRAIKTPKGIGIGATENEVRQAYGDRIVAASHPDAGEGGIWMTISSSDKSRGITFNLYKGRVNFLWTGLYPAIKYYEGCL